MYKLLLGKAILVWYEYNGKILKVSKTKTELSQIRKLKEGVRLEFDPKLINARLEPVNHKSEIKCGEGYRILGS